MNGDAFLRDLAETLDEYRFDEVSPLLERIDPAAFTDGQAVDALARIRRDGLFGELEKAAGLFVLAGHDLPAIRAQWAQALLDQGRTEQALTALSTIQGRTDNARDSAQIVGLIGRAHKQLYLSSADPEHLRQAVAAYGRGWEAKGQGHRWHGINLSALLARAARDGVEIDAPAAPDAVAGAILQEVRAIQSPGVWDCATAMEAAIASGDEAQALGWAATFLKHESAGAFEVGSALRQLKEVWSLEGTDLGRKLLPVVEFELLQRRGGTLELTSTGVGDDSGFEAVHGTEGTVYLQWMDTMYRRSAAVARVKDKRTGAPQGTGFVVDGVSMDEAWAGPVFVTNAHVLSTDPVDEAPLRPRDAEAEFTALPGRPKVELAELLFSSPRTALDVSVTRIAPIDGAGPLSPTKDLPLLAREGDPPQRIYVVGHPSGGELAVSLYDNDLVGYADPYVHYRSPTEHGSSGSPVFSRQWALFAMHHRSRPALRANEGVLFAPILRAIDA